MKFKELCQARFSCRSYDKERIIEPEKLEYIRECVQLAPSAVNRQPWKFMFVTEQDKLEILKAAYNRDWINQAPAIVVCCKKEEEAWTRRYDNKNHADIDLAIAIEHLVLAAAEQGLGSCWVCNFRVNELRETFPLPEGYEIVALVPLGYPAEDIAPKIRKEMDEIWM